MRMVVVLPAPFGPTNPKASPRSTREDEVVHRGGLPEPLGQTLDLDHAVTSLGLHCGPQRKRTDHGGSGGNADLHQHLPIGTQEVLGMRESEDDGRTRPRWARHRGSNPRVDSPSWRLPCSGRRRPRFGASSANSGGRNRRPRCWRTAGWQGQPTAGTWRWPTPPPPEANTRWSLRRDPSRARRGRCKHRGRRWTRRPPGSDWTPATPAPAASAGGRAGREGAPREARCP